MLADHIKEKKKKPNARLQKTKFLLISTTQTSLMGGQSRRKHRFEFR